MISRIEVIRYGQEDNEKNKKSVITRPCIICNNLMGYEDLIRFNVVCYDKNDREISDVYGYVCYSCDCPDIDEKIETIYTIHNIL